LRRPGSRVPRPGGPLLRFTPSFVKRYAEAGAAIKDAVARYAADVRNGSFPAEGQSFGMKDEVLKRVMESR